MLQHLQGNKEPSQKEMCKEVIKRYKASIISKIYDYLIQAMPPLVVICPIAMHDVSIYSP